jgi:glycosidase
MPVSRRLTCLVLLLLAAASSPAETVFEITDPRGDDHGDGQLLYPSLRFAKGDLDLKSFKVENKGDKAVFTVEFHNPIREPERGAADELGNDFTKIARHGFYQFNIDIYIDTDRRLGSGHVRTLPGRLVEVDPATAWDVAVIASPRPSVMARMLRSLLREDLRTEIMDDPDAPATNDELDERLAATIDRHTHYPTSFKVRRNRISFEVPLAVLGGEARDTWAYTVFVTGANLEASLELMSSIGGRESLEAQLGVLPVSPGEWRERFGGGRKGEPLQPPVVDLFVPEGRQQEWLLADYDSGLNRRAVLPGVVPGAGPRTAGDALAATWQGDRWRGETAYEIFVRSFRDSDGDGIGDFRGLTAALDYLNDGDPETDDDLGVGTLWLMPVFASPSYHGYDAIDYYRVNPQYGTEADFDELLRQCHRRGIKVVLDLMLNHSSDQHPWFVDSASGPQAARRDWYVWRDDDPGWTQPWGGTNRTWHRRGDAYYYGIFWGGMPDLNYRNPDVMAEAQAIARFWLDRGVDGFRLDAARHLVEAGPGQQQNDTPETHAAWRDFSAFMRREYPDRLMLGEVWADAPEIAAYYGDTSALVGGDEFAMTFNFPLAGGALQAVNLADAGPLVAALAGVRSHYPQGVLDGVFLANHDMPRIASQLGDDQAKLRQAAAVLLTLPGTPWLYYGEEVGLRNGPTRDDEDKRTPMPWTDGDAGFTAGVPWHRAAPGRETANVAEQVDDPESLLSRYRTLIHLRAAEPALGRGDLVPVALGEGPRDVAAWERRHGDRRLLVVHNLADEARTVAWQLEGVRGYELVFGDPGVGLPAGGGITLPARATGIWAVR